MKNSTLKQRSQFCQGEFIGSADQNGCGKGTFKNTSLQLFYEGEFENWVPHGQGRLMDRGTIFQGWFCKGMKKNGVMIWNKGTCSYEGEFENDVFHGKGLLVFPSLYYEGQFQNGQKHGKGVCKWKVGSKFEGEYANGEKSGHGVLYNTDMTLSYQGNWERDCPHGQGTAYIGGVAESGRWKYGKLLPPEPVPKKTEL